MSFWSEYASPAGIFNTLKGVFDDFTSGKYYDRNGRYGYNYETSNQVRDWRKGLDRTFVKKEGNSYNGKYETYHNAAGGGGTTMLVPSAGSGAQTYYDTTTVPDDVYGEWTPYLEYLREQSDENTRWNELMAERQNEWQRETNAIQMDFNAAEAQKNRDWQEMMSNTAHQREVEDLKAAGLNPILSATGGNGAAVTSGATASGATSAGVKPEKDTTFVLGLLNFLNNVMGYATSTASAGISAGGVMGAAALSAEATRYASDNSYMSNQNNTNTPWAFLRRLLDSSLASAWNDSRVSGYGVGDKWYNNAIHTWQTRSRNR